LPRPLRLKLAAVLSLVHGDIRKGEFSMSLTNRRLKNAKRSFLRRLRTLMGQRIVYSIGLALLIATSTIGCASIKLPFGNSRIQSASSTNPVVQIVSIWQPSEGRDPDGLPCRGFAGQILFLANRGTLPVKVGGKVRIYVFDDQGSSDEQSRPLHQFDFDSESWNVHLLNSVLGPSYHVFIPYTRKGNYETTCALRIRFETDYGMPVFSDLVSVALSGKKNQKEDEIEVASSKPDDHHERSPSLRRTTTIVPNKDQNNGHTPKNPIVQAGYQVPDVEPTRAKRVAQGKTKDALSEAEIDQLIGRMRKQNLMEDKPSQFSDSTPIEQFPNQISENHPLLDMSVK